VTRPITLFTGQWAAYDYSVGHGDAPWEHIFRKLNEIGYKGPISVDVAFSQGH
jgi:sugar phosphate isomerase/epimerase